MSEHECVLILRIDRGYEKSHSVAVNIGREYTHIPDKDDCFVGSIPLVNMDQFVEILKKRKLTTDMIKKAATKLGEQLAAQLEDEAGWHGEKRRELINEQR